MLGGDFHSQNSSTIFYMVTLGSYKRYAIGTYLMMSIFFQSSIEATLVAGNFSIKVPTIEIIVS